MYDNITFEEYFDIISKFSPSSFKYFLKKLNCSSDYSNKNLMSLLLKAYNKNVDEQIPHLTDVGILSSALADKDYDLIKKVVTELLNK